MKSEYLLPLILVLLAVPIHAQQVPEPIVIDTVCAERGLIGCAVDGTGDGKIYLAHCYTKFLTIAAKTPRGNYNIWKQGDETFDSFEACQKYCIEYKSGTFSTYEDNSVNSGPSYNKCVHANGFEFPKLTFTGESYPKSVGGCMADDGIFSCSDADHMTNCEDVNGCEGKQCIWVPAKACGQPALATICNRPAERVADNNIYADQTTGTEYDQGTITSDQQTNSNPQVVNADNQPADTASNQPETTAAEDQQQNPSVPEAPVRHCALIDWGWLCI